MQLGVLDGTEVLFLERLSAPAAVISYTRIAGRLPLHASASGLALLAHSPRSFQESVLAGRLEKFTERTVTSPAVLRVSLAEVRSKGVAYCPGHIHEEALSLAVPVFDRKTKPVAAVGVIVPMNTAVGQSIAPALMATARGISRAMTGRALAVPPPGRHERTED